MKKILLSLLCLISVLSYSQDRIEGFLEDRFIEDQTYKNKTQLEKLTDVYIAFALPDAATNDLKWRFSLNNLKRFSAFARGKGLRVHASIGGATQGSTGWTTVISTDAKRKAFAANIAKQVKSLRLNGVNLDWEFPDGQYATSYNLLAGEIRRELDALEPTIGWSLELSAAVAPLQWNNGGINSSFISKMDYIHVMAFDDGGCGPCGGPNHSSLTHATNAVNYWINTKGVTPSQIVLAIPFYSNTKALYKNFSASNPAGYFNAPNGSFGGQYFNSKPLILQKIEMVTNKGGSGLFIWEITQDRTDQYSLLSAIHDELGGNLGCPKPKLGSNVNLCDAVSANLNGAVSEPGATYQWYKNNTLISGETNSNLTVTKAGTYKVVRKLASCDDAEASVSVTSELLDIDDEVVCSGKNATLEVNNPSGIIKWYASVSGGAVLETGNSYETPQIISETKYYAEKEGSSNNSCDGTATWEAKSYSGGSEVVHNGKKYKAKWWAESSNVPGGGNPWEYLEDCAGKSCARTPVTISLDVCDGVFSANENEMLEVYPNPISDELNVNFNDGTTIDFIQLVSTNGNLVKELFVQDSKATINISDVESGVYVVKITTGDISYVQKVIKK